MKLFSLLFLIISLQSFAGDELNVHLLTSLNERDGKIEKKIEKKVKKVLKNVPHKLTTIFKADQEDIYNTLTDKSVDAVFWVSHGGFKKLKNESAGIGVENVILDYNGDNVAPLFQLVSSHLKFLAIIGCNSEDILESYKEKGYLSQYENLITYISKRKAIAQFAIKKAAKKLRKYYWRGQLSASEDVKKLKEKKEKTIVHIKRTLPATPKAIRIMHNGKLLGLLSKKTQDYSLEISYDIKPPNLEFFTGENIIKKSSRESIGKLELSSPTYNWKLFTKNDGEPFGVNSLLYLPVLKKGL